jgi:hypothetical protein
MSRDWDAHLDPWCVARLATGEKLLFGYALVHPKTGGLGWMTSSYVASLDLSSGRARTASGRLYRLGRRFDVMDVGAEGEEARTAFDLAIGRDFDDALELRALDHNWVATCKAARFLKVRPPKRTRAAVDAFIDKHTEAYIELRRRLAES